ncbi:MAG: LamG-like jellyroll fold domain-containing protein [Bacteroidota bacterium]
MKDDTTEYRGYPMPHIDNFLQEDVSRLRESLTGIDGDIQTLNDGLAQHKTNVDAQLEQQQTSLQANIDDQKTALEAELATTREEIARLQETLIGTVSIEGPSAPFQGQRNLAYRVDIEGAIGYEWSAEGLHIQGQEDALEIVTSEVLDQIGATYTVSLWIKARALTGTMDLIGKSGAALRLALTAEGSLVHTFRQGNPEEVITLQSPPGQVKTNTWHHVAVTSDGDKVQLFRDGKLVGEANSRGPLATPGNLFIGKQAGSAPERHFIGAMGRLRVYNQTLSPAKLRFLLRQERPAGFSPGPDSSLLLYLPLHERENNRYSDYSLYRRSIERRGNLNLENDSVMAQAAYFDGGSDCLVLDQVAELDAAALHYTAMVWVRPHTSASGIRSVLGTSGRSYLLKLDGDNYKIRHEFRTASDSSASIPEADFPNMRDGNWHHIAIWNDGQEARTYLNGTVVSQAPVTELTVSPGRLVIGCDPLSVTYDQEDFYGHMAQLRLYNRALPESELREIMADDYAATHPPAPQLHLPLDGRQNPGNLDTASHQHTTRIRGLAATVEDEQMGPVLQMNYDPSPQSIVATASAQGEAATLSVNVLLPGNLNLRKTRTLPLRTPSAPRSEILRYTGQIVSWTVPPEVRELTIEASGGQGGHGAYNMVPKIPGGKGARMKGTFSVEPGEELLVLVGEQGHGLNNTYGHGVGGGGGGTFVVRVDPQGPHRMNVGDRQYIRPLIVAGGGGGGGQDRYGQTSPAGVGQTGEEGQGFDNIAGGKNGQGGSPGTYCGGGAGLIGDGGVDYANPSRSFLNGGGPGSGRHHARQVGGFGGGGGAGLLPGGGGGYSGGSVFGSWNSSGRAGGGGSYNAGTDQVNEAGVNEGNGKVILRY